MMERMTKRQLNDWLMYFTEEPFGPFYPAMGGKSGKQMQTVEEFEATAAKMYAVG